MNATRQDFVNFALRYAGATATGARSKEYLDLLTRRAETDQMRRDMAKMSSCALFVRALWWCFGAEHPVYNAPYNIGKAPAEIITMAKSKDAYVGGAKINPECFPREADAFYITAKGGQREHFGVITKVLSTRTGSWSFETVEGGQGVGGRGVNKLTRTVLKTGGMHGSMGDRFLIAWFDFDALSLPGLRPGWGTKDKEDDDNPYK